MIEVPFIGQSYKMDVLDVSAQTCKNMYPEVYNDGKTKTVMSLRNTAGLSSFGSVSGSWFMRALYLASTGKFFAVRGSQVSTFDTAGAETTRFTLNTGGDGDTQGIVRMADNGTQMLVVDGTANGYTYNLSTDVATVISDADYPGGTHVAFLDGYYLVNKPSSLFVYYSAQDDPTSWSTLSTLSKEGSSDYVNALIAHNRRLWVFGEQSYEVFYNTGDSNNQFLRIEGTYHNIGCEAPDSVAENGNNVYWLGSDGQGFGQIFMSQGFDAVAISTVPIEREIHTYTTTSDAEGITYQQDGHEFYQLTFPSENKTWVFDSTTGMWHEKSYRNASTSVDERHLARVHGFFNGKNYVGDHRNGNIYSFEQGVYTDNGDTIIRERTSPVIWNALERLYFSSFQLDIDGGVGLATGQGSDPIIQFSYSKDGGYTWSDEIQIKAGKIGEYRTRAKKNRLGASREMVFRVRYSEPTKFNILNAHVEFE